MTIIIAGTTPLHYAAAKNYVDIIALLIDHGEDVNKKDRQGVGFPLNSVGFA